MKLTVNRSAFCEAFKTVLTAAKNGAAVKVPGAYMTADENRKIAELTGTDIITSVIKRIRNVDIKGGGEVILPPVALEILRRTKAGSVSLETDGNGVLHISFGFSRYDLPTKPVNEFPKSAVAFPTVYASVTGLPSLLKHAAFAAEKSGEDRQLQCVKIRLTPGISTAEAMNRKRMVSATGRNISDGEADMLLHISAVNILSQLLTDNKTVYAGIADKRAVFVCEDTVFSTVMMNCRGPVIEELLKRIIPEYCADIGAKELLKAVETATVCQLAGDDRCINICLTPMGIKLTCAAYGRTGSAFVPTLCDSPTPEPGFNYDPQIITDFLRVTAGNVSVKIDKRGFMLLEGTDGIYIVTPRNAVNIVKPKAKPEKTEKAEKKTAKKTKKVA